ncbi:type III secretion system domain-containing protein [Pandoraea sp.]|uniref:type III secretion system domain-containing protein n=1 Tax=Pandoraea sp. TaxID=1883445 RepID=UPI0035ADD374
MTRAHNADIARLASMIWQPGRHMDEGWWHAFDMLPWQTAYRQHAVCRAHVDRLLIERRGWPGAAASDCAPPASDAARDALRLLPRLRRVSLAHGLRVLGCPDYLLLGRYRRALSSWLDAWQCDRLLLTRQAWPARAALPPEQVVRAALATAGTWLDSAPEPSCVDLATVGKAARILLPPPAAAGPSPIDVPIGGDDIWQRLATLEKMLCMSSTAH